MILRLFVTALFTLMVIIVKVSLQEETLKKPFS